LSFDFEGRGARAPKYYTLATPLLIAYFKKKKPLKLLDIPLLSRLKKFLRD